MEITIQVVLLLVGFFMLVKGADWFVEGAAGIADRFGIPQIVIGLTIVAFGTSAPEAAVSINAALNGNAGLTIGNILGSNIFNILIILGITSVITPLVVQKTTFRYEIPFVMVITGVLYCMGIDGIIGLSDGVILWGFMLVFLGYLLFMTKKGLITLEEEVADEKASILKLAAFTVIGGALIIWGSELLVSSATVIAETFGMSDRLIGLTIIAFGTSLPELITSITAGMKGKADIAVGNIIGSNVFNVLFVVGTAALVAAPLGAPIEFAPQFLVDSLISVVITIVLWFFIFKDKKLKRYAGYIMLAGYVGYFIYLI